MLHWVRKSYRDDLVRSGKLEEALADAEAELILLQDEFDNAPMLDGELLRQVDEMEEEVNALRQKCQELQKENERLKTAEAAGAIFLESVAGKTIIQKLESLEKENAELQEALDEALIK